MTLFVEVAGTRVLEARVVLPKIGAFHADVTLDGEKTIAARSTLTVAGLSLVVSPWRPVVPYAGRTSARLVGGAGKLGRTLEAKPYGAPAGVRLSTVLADVARDSGETIRVATDRVVGRTHFVRERAIASRLLNSLATTWYVDTDGTIVVDGVRPSTLITSAFEVISFDGARGAAVVATEKPADWTPGRRFTSSRVAGTHTISCVSHVVSKGALRTEVLIA